VRLDLLLYARLAGVAYQVRRTIRFDNPTWAWYKNFTPRIEQAVGFRIYGRFVKDA